MDAASSCPLGAWRYADGGACLPADPCFDADPCAGAHRVCTNAEGSAACGRCLDGFAEASGACAPFDEPYVGPFRVGRDYFRVWDGTRYRSLFVHGIDLGATPPGTGPGGFGASPEQYARWIAAMREGGANVVRVYSLHAPAFYEALAAYDVANPDAPLYLLQGAYLAETDGSEESNDVASREASFDAQIAEMIDCLHGACTANGGYPDVSRWTLGYIVGHELSYLEVGATDAAHPDWTSYEGTTMRLASGSPTEVWIARRLDRAVTYEMHGYGESRPIAFSSWPEIDPLDHPTEGPRSHEDAVAVDVGRIDPFGAPAGMFLSYHVYPHYPNFVGDDPRYRAYADTLGRDSYRGYLHDLRARDPDRAFLVAEYGTPTSVGRAHPSASGMHEGFLTEREVGTFAARMLRDIDVSGMAGGVYFQWGDGWWKHSWITSQRVFPTSRLRVWHDVMDPESSYGLMAYDPTPFDFDAAPPLWSSDAGRVRDVRAGTNAEVFSIQLTLAAPLADGERLVIGLDTYAGDRGESVLPDGTRATLRSELALEIVAPDTAALRVMAAYDLIGLQLDSVPAGGALRSVASDGGAWNAMEWVSAWAHTSDDGRTQFPEVRFPIGTLSVWRAGEEEQTSLDSVHIDGARVEVALPWALLQFTDPSARQVFDDDPGTEALDATTSEGIALAIAIGGELVETARVSWPTWDTAPPTTERLKRGAETFFEAMRAYPRWRD